MLKRTARSGVYPQWGKSSLGYKNACVACAHTHTHTFYFHTKLFFNPDLASSPSSVSAQRGHLQSVVYREVSTAARDSRSRMKGLICSLDAMSGVPGWFMIVCVRTLVMDLLAISVCGYIVWKGMIYYGMACQFWWHLGCVEGGGYIQYDKKCILPKGESQSQQSSSLHILIFIMFIRFSASL